MDHPARRRQRLTRLLKAEDLDALLITHPLNVTYLTGFSGEASWLVLGRQRVLLVTDGRFTTQLAEECPGLELHVRPVDQTLQEAGAEVLQSLGLRRVGFESGHLTVADGERLSELAPAVDWKPARDRVEQLRAVKDPSEVGEIREAVAIAERAFGMFCAMLGPEDREKDLGDAMEMYIRRAGGRCGSFPAIVAAGRRAALPHAPPTDQPVGEAGWLLIDWGARGRFYKSDLTRVLRLSTMPAFSRGKRRDKPDARLEQVHAVVRAAQQEAIAAIRPGVKAADVDAVARGAIDRAGLGRFFTHGLGHGIGLQVHEAPFLRANSADVLEAGMVLTVEPGIYLPNWGGVRIEDDVLVTPDGCEVLTGVSRELGTMGERGG